MAITDISGRREQEKIKSQKKLLTKVIIIGVVSLLIAVVVLTRSLWYPKLDGIVAKISTYHTGAEDAQLAQGQFPVALGTGTNTLVPLDNSFIVIDDSHLFMYDINGNLSEERQHTFSNPIASATRKKALIYDSGGKGFRLESKYKTIFEKTADNTILSAQLGKNDYSAIVTKSEKYLSQLEVYDSDGIRQFTYKSYDGRIINTTFTANNTGAIETILGAQDGNICSKLICLDFSIDRSVWESEPFYTLALETVITGEGKIVVAGDDRLIYFNENGTYLDSFEYGDVLVDYDCSDKLTAVILQNSALRKNSMMIFDYSVYQEPVCINIEKQTRDVAVYNDYVYTLSDNGVTVYDKAGNELNVIELEDYYTNIHHVGNYIFLQGYDAIDRMDLG